MEGQKLYFLKAVEIFQDLSADDMARLDRMTHMSNYKKGQLIYLPEDTREELFLLKKGKIQVYRLSSEGKKLIIATLESGTFFGEMSLVGQGMYEAFAEALEDALICVMSKNDVMHLLSTKPAVALRLLETLGSRLLQAQKSLDDLAFKNVQARIASLLLRLANQQKSNAVEGISHQEIADMIAAFRETVTQVLGEFKSLKLIEMGRRQITILDTAGLKRIAEG